MYVEHRNIMNVWLDTVFSFIYINLNKGILNHNSMRWPSWSKARD